MPGGVRRGTLTVSDRGNRGMDPQLETFIHLFTALGLGALIGVERGWEKRELPEGARIAGIRTFALIGLLGAVWALLAARLGDLALGFGFLGFAVVLLFVWWRRSRDSQDYGATTLVAALLTFALGALAMLGEPGLATAAAVVTALLLGIKPTLHGFVARLRREELLAVLQLLVMSLVLLPVLPNRGFGPWQVLNPFELWLMVVLICAMSMVGYVAVRLVGGTRGVLVAGLAGGLISSTAVALGFARLGRRDPSHAPLIGAGILLASTTLFPRSLVVVAIIEPDLLPRLALPAAFAVLGGLAATALLVRRHRAARTAPESALPVQNPFEFGVALRFAVLLAAILLLARAASEWLGEIGVLALAAVSGLADVDAINLSLARMAGEWVGIGTAATGIVIAAISNSLVKAAIAGWAGGAAMARQVVPGMAAIVAGAVLGLVLS